MTIVQFKIRKSTLIQPYYIDFIWILPVVPIMSSITIPHPLGPGSNWGSDTAFSFHEIWWDRQVVNVDREERVWGLSPGQGILRMWEIRKNLKMWWRNNSGSGREKPGESCFLDWVLRALGYQDCGMSPAHPYLCQLAFAGLQTTPEHSGLKQLFV